MVDESGRCQKGCCTSEHAGRRSVDGLQEDEHLFGVRRTEGYKTQGP